MSDPIVFCYWCQSEMSMVVRYAGMLHPSCSYHKSQFVGSSLRVEYFDRIEGRQLLEIERILRE